ncbi:MAG: hypothetical protein CMG62_11620 [Candidatus Marinimicrobia bacterium]|nr:hypothetical protein [Candidatus Neomarinimicrobiota bacterium]|tara:strand:+ start:522 stop:1613 length:1092 start_codon:yes stop_codon:yes gene_type:complete
MIIVSTKELTIRKFLIYLIRSLIKLNIDIVIISKDSLKLEKLFSLEEKKYINLIDFNFPITISQIVNPFIFFKTLYKLRLIIDNFPKHSIYIHTPIAAHLIRLSCFFIKRKIIYHVHGFRFHKLGNKLSNLFYFIIEYILKFKVYKYITINKYDYDVVNNYFKIKNTLIPGVGINIDYLKNIKTNFKIKDNKLKVLVVGAYKKEKGYHQIISLANSYKINNKILIDCYGYGNYESFNNKIKFNRNVEINFNNFADNILDKIINYNCILIPSKREGLSVIIMESMAIGIPIITTNARGCSDLIQNKINGSLYKYNSVNDLILILNDMMKNYDFYLNMTKKAKIHCNENYEIKKVTNRIIENIIN